MRLLPMLLILIFSLIFAHYARADMLATPQSGADFAEHCLVDSAPHWYAVEESSARLTRGWYCNFVVANAWVFVPGGARYARCGATAMPILRRNVVAAYVRKHPTGIGSLTQEQMALDALISAFNCKAGE